jgi:hypothetical protein
MGMTNRDNPERFVSTAVRPWMKVVLIGAVSLGFGALAWPKYHQLSIQRDLERWDPSKAEIEARRDIQKGTIKIYLHGTVAAQAAGVEDCQLSLIRGIPTKPAGVGCLVGNEKLRAEQGEYAIRYNKLIVSHLQGR